MTIATLPIPRDSAPVELTAELVSTDPTGGRLVAWAEAARAAAALGTALSKTSFVPKAFQGKPEECAAAILCGDEVGLSPLASLRSIFVIGGTPGMYARTMVAVVQSAGHEVVPVKEAPGEVTVKGRRHGSDEWVTATWTTERARRAGYTSNKKYETDPVAMLYARAAGDVCRRIAADALLGIPYTVEELELSEPTPTTRVTRSTTRVQRAEPVETPEPSFDDEPTPIPDEPLTIPPVTKQQLTKMGASFTSAGITDRTARLEYVAKVIGREVASSKDLDRAEASTVIDRLMALELSIADAPDDEPEQDEPAFDVDAS